MKDQSKRDVEGNIRKAKLDLVKTIAATANGGNYDQGVNNQMMGNYKLD